MACSEKMLVVILPENEIWFINILKSIIQINVRLAIWRIVFKRLGQSAIKSLFVGWIKLYFISRFLTVFDCVIKCCLCMKIIMLKKQQSFKFISPFHAVINEWKVVCIIL